MPETVSDTRKNLTRYVRGFREKGTGDEPVVFGDNGQPETALVPYPTFEILLKLAEDLVVVQRIREREATDSGNRTSLGEVADELGVDFDTL